MQAQVDLESDSSSDSQDELSRAAILQAQTDALMVPTDEEGYEKVKGAKPKVAASYHAYPPSLATYDQQSLSCGLFTQYGKYIGQSKDVYKVSDSLPKQKAQLGKKPSMKAFLTHVIEQLKTSPAILDCQTLLILSDTKKLADIKHWKHTARWIVDRTAYVGPDADKWFALFVPSSLFKCHYTWTATYILKALVPFLPRTDLVLLDHDATFTTLFEKSQLSKLALNLDLP